MKKYLPFYVLLYFVFLVGCKRGQYQESSFQPFLNLDFRGTIPRTDKPERWFLGESGYNVKRVLKANGQGYEMKIYSAVPQQGDFGMILNHIPVEMIKGKTVVLKTRIRTDNITSGYAGLWCGINQPWGPFDFTEWNKKAIEGSVEWTEMSEEILIPEDAEGFNFGGILNGKGVVWFDSFEVYIDGEKYIDEKIVEPAISELSWLENNLHPLKSCSPNEESDDDLKILGQLIKDSKVVALGEVTHGSSEIYQMKHRIIKYLAEKKNFDVFSLEVDMAKAYNINKYTKDGKGDLKNLLDSLFFWTWNTQEMFDFGEWMKSYNSQSEKRMLFAGFDTQMYQGSIDELKKSFSEDKNALNLINLLEDELLENKRRILQNKEMQEPVPLALAEKIEMLINKINVQVTESGKPKEEKDWLKQNLNVIVQSLDISDDGRDQAMADNFRWIMGQNPNSKFIIWAHNAHITKGGVSMGHHLSRELMGNYVNIGFTFYEGSYTAIGDKGITAYEAQTAHLGTYEYYYHKMDCSMFILDLRKVRDSKRENVKWLNSKLQMRTTGALKTENEFNETDVTNDYDLIIFINKSTPSRLLRSY